MSAIANAAVVGQELVLTVQTLAYGGEGLAKEQGRVVFIPDALPGDVVRVRITQVKPKFLRAEVLEQITPSGDRVQAVCRQALACGGCSWQQLAYPAQLAAKQEFVNNALQHIGKLKQVPMQPILKAAELWGYRQKIQIPLQAGPEGLAAGFFAKRSHHLVPINECPIQPALGNRILQTVIRLANAFGYTGYAESQHTGDLRHLIIRLGQATQEALVVLVTREANLPRLAEWASELMREVPEVVGVVQNHNPARTNVILGGDFRVLAGRDHFHEQVRDLKFKISAGSFFQVNPFQLPALADAVLAGAALSGGEAVADLFCGVGWLTLELARQARQVAGVENIPQAISDARENQKLNRLEHVEFHLADAAAGVKLLQARKFKPDVVVLDPPRKGCEPALLEKLRAWHPDRIVYVSCNPVTLARDLALLLPGGYALTRVQPVDLFPHTYHVESVATLVKK